MRVNMQKRDIIIRVIHQQARIYEFTTIEYSGETLLGVYNKL